MWIKYALSGHVTSVTIVARQFALEKFFGMNEIMAFSSSTFLHHTVHGLASLAIKVNLDVTQLTRLVFHQNEQSC